MFGALLALGLMVSAVFAVDQVRLPDLLPRLSPLGASPRASVLFIRTGRAMPPRSRPYCSARVPSRS